MLQRFLPVIVSALVVVVLAGDAVAEPGLWPSRANRGRTSKSRYQKSSHKANRSKQPSHTPTKVSNTRRPSTSITGNQTSKKTANPRLARKVRHVLDTYYRKPLNTRDDAPWSVMHWSIAYGMDAQICAGGPGGQRVAAIDWLCCNRPAAGKQLVSEGGNGLNLPIAPGIQGHHGQFLAILAQSGVPLDYVLRVGDDEMEVADLLEHEKQTCQRGMELTFKLIGISHYTPSDETWKNNRGETWSVKKLLMEELKGPINRLEACCGGTHRVFALNYAVDRRRKEGLPITDSWQTAARRVQAYQRRAFQLQNKDGSFSTLWFEARENRNDKTRKLITSGHVLELLAYSLPEQRLHDANFERAVEYIANLLDRSQGTRLHRGGMGHSLHALAIYEQRVLGAKPGQRTQVAKRVQDSMQPTVRK